MLAPRDIIDIVSTFRPPVALPICLAICLGVCALVGCDTGSSATTMVSNDEPGSRESAAETSDDASQPSAADPSKSPDEASGRYLEKTFDDIKFDIEPDAHFERSMLTEEIEQLAGKKIRIRGYILPTPQKKGIKQFVLVRDNQECCFGPGAALYDCILVTMKPGKTAEFSIRPVAVEGEFNIQIFKPLDRVMAIFHLDADAVKN